MTMALVQKQGPVVHVLDERRGFGAKRGCVHLARAGLHGLHAHLRSLKHQETLCEVHGASLLNSKGNQRFHVRSLTPGRW